MKIRNLFLSLIISGVSLASATAQRPLTDAASASSATRNASRHIGDDAAATSGTHSDYQMVQYDPAVQEQQIALAPTAMSYQPQAVSGSCGSGSCGTGGCYGGGDYGCSSRGYGLGCGSGCGCSPNMWFGAETLLWWGQNRNTPPLLTTSAQGVLPVAGQPGVTNAVGGIDGISSGLLPGYRLSSGMYFGPEQRVGISGRVFGIYDSTNTTTRSGDGIDQSVGLPFFNSLIGQPDAYLVAFNNGVPFSTGSASVTDTLELFSADSSLRFLVSDSHDHRVELLGGYTYLNLEDSLAISSTSVDTFTGNLTPDGTVTQTNDLFATENRFHGGHLGLQSTVSRSRVSLTTLSKVSFGNMRQTGNITGSTAVSLPPGAAVNTAGGIYTQQSNIGGLSRDTFAFIPELGIKGGLAIRENVHLTAGYTFLYISKAALAGNQVDTNLDLSQAQGGAAAQQPAFNYREGSMWFQGIDLGVNFTF